jgi:hypothetical protein
MIFNNFLYLLERSLVVLLFIDYVVIMAIFGISGTSGTSGCSLDFRHFRLSWSHFGHTV